MSPATVLALRPPVFAEDTTSSTTTTLAMLEEVSARIQEVRTIQETKQIHDVAKAARVYASEHKLGREVVLKAKAVAVEALRRIGELLDETERAVGGRPYQKRTGTDPELVQTLAGLGIDKKTSSRAQQLFALPRDVFARVRDSHTTLDRVLADAKRAAELEALRDHVQDLQHGLGVEHDLRVCSCADLFASGITPDVVITEPPRGREHLSAFADLARACVDVPLIAVRVHLPYLPDVLDHLRAHLTYRGGDMRDNRLVLVFGHADAFQRAKARVQTTGHLFYSGWEEYFVQTLAGSGELVCDPFLTSAIALAALQHKRRFVGANVDADVVDEARGRIGASSWS